MTCDRGSRTSSSPRRGRHSDYRPEPRGHFVHRWTSPRQTLARAWVRSHRVQANPFASHQGRGVPGTNHVCHISPRLRFVYSPLGDNTLDANPFTSHQGRGVPGTNHVCHISPRLRFVYSPLGDNTLDANPFTSHQGRGVSGTNHVCHNLPSTQVRPPQQPKKHLKKSHCVHQTNPASASVFTTWHLSKKRATWRRLVGSHRPNWQLA